MKESDMITRSNLEFEVIAAEVEAVTARVLESYEDNDVVELAALLDATLRKDGIAMKFVWLYSRASVALND
jgi:hypothetical protein